MKRFKGFNSDFKYTTTEGAQGKLTRTTVFKVINFSESGPR